MYHTLKRVDTIITMNVILLLTVALLLFVSRGLLNNCPVGYYPMGILPRQILAGDIIWGIMSLNRSACVLLRRAEAVSVPRCFG